MAGFTILSTAKQHMDGVVDAGTKDYAIVVTLNPKPIFFCYGIRNKTTFVDEAMSASLPKARYLAKEMQRDLDEGFDRQMGEIDSVLEALGATPSIKKAN